MALKIIIDLSDYRAWSGAKNTWQRIQDEGKVDEFEQLMEKCYPDGLTKKELNDMLWFDGEQVLKDLGIIDDEDEEDDEDNDEQ